MWGRNARTRFTSKRNGVPPATSLKKGKDTQRDLYDLARGSTPWTPKGALMQTLRVRQCSHQLQRARSAPELTLYNSKTHFPWLQAPICARSGAFSHPEWVATQITDEKKDHIGLRLELAAVSANLIECRITQSIKCRITWFLEFTLIIFFNNDYWLISELYYYVYY